MFTISCDGNDMTDTIHVGDPPHNPSLRIALASERFDDVATAWKRIARELNPRVKPEPRSQNFTEAFRLVTPEFDIVDPVGARGRLRHPCHGTWTCPQEKRKRSVGKPELSDIVGNGGVTFERRLPVTGIPWLVKTDVSMPSHATRTSAEPGEGTRRGADRAVGDAGL